MSSEAAFLHHVGGLEFIFAQIKHDLSFAANTLDVAFDEAESGANGVPHPMKLLRRIERLEALAGNLQTDWMDIEERRNVIIPEVRSLGSTGRFARAAVCAPSRVRLASKFVAHSNPTVCIHKGHSWARGEYGAHASPQLDCRVLRA
jgi:hypothetical protein